MKGQTIYTVTTNCHNCSRCVRACPVKAIRVGGGQAQIEGSLCVHCGTCVRECPQKAKIIRSDKDIVKKWLSDGEVIAVSVAPSFAAVYGRNCNRLPSVLRGLGFRYIAETSEGAAYITEKSFDKNQKGHICATCPAVVEYVEKYRPNQLKHLIPVTSPMVMHGRMLKEAYNNCKVVFIGPCAAKKEEILRPENKGAIDAALTFDELSSWLTEENLSIEHSMDSGFDSVYKAGDARLFPLEGGMLKTGGFETGIESDSYIKLSGSDAVFELFDDKNVLFGADYIEPLFCKGGCINGPAMPKNLSKFLFERRQGVIDHWAKSPTNDTCYKFDINADAVFCDKSADLHLIPVSENSIRKALSQIGRLEPSQQLNCEACGYKSCIESATAIVRGMAEPEICVAYTRSLAQQRTDRIIETTPNGIVILDSDLNMIKMNLAFKKMFMCDNSILGRRISYLVDSHGFEEMQSGAQEKYESIQTKYGIRYHEILYALRDEGQYVGIYANLSNINFDEKQFNLIKEQTLTHAREFLEHQIRFAQDITHYLGKSTAESEDIAKRLIGIYENIGTGDEK